MFVDRDGSVGPVGAFGPGYDCSRGHGFPKDGAMGCRRDAQEDLSTWDGCLEGRVVLCCVVRLSRMPVLPATGCLRSFGGLGRTCIIDLYAGEDALVLGAAVPLD